MRTSFLTNTVEQRLDDFVLARAKELLSERFDHPPLAYLHSFGCQQNAADTERIRGLLALIGFGFTDDAQNADLVLFNTCAVRESAEDRVLGHVGALKGLKTARPDMMIALGGCMMQQQRVADRIKQSFPYVDIVFGTGSLHLLPAMIAERISNKKRVFYGGSAKNVIEGVPSLRDDAVKAWLPIMQGCNNFCSYCIVPYVRGRETSRDPDMVLAEAKELIAKGYKEITLLGQNVNSYGKNLSPAVSFAELLRRIDEIDGEYRIRFMTSHPRDCSLELIDTIAESRHICRHIHLPVQSGSDRILKEMNRHYDSAHYRSLIEYAKNRIPDVTFSSDIIVGFPGETRADFEETLRLVKEVGYNALFTFIYSRRAGTPAASMADIVTERDKSEWFRELLALQQGICESQNLSMVGSTIRVLIDSQGKGGENALSGRTEGNVIVETRGGRELIGSFVNVRVDKAMNWAVEGTITE